MENERKALLRDARIAIPFKCAKMRMSILVYEDTKENAERKAAEFSRRYVNERMKSISERIGKDAVMIAEPRVQAFRTNYLTVI